MTAPEVTREEAERRLTEHVRDDRPVTAGGCVECTRRHDSYVVWPCEVVRLARTVVALYDEQLINLGNEVPYDQKVAEGAMQNMRECIDRLRDGWLPYDFADEGWCWVPRHPPHYDPVPLTPGQQAVMAR